MKLKGVLFSLVVTSLCFGQASQAKVYEASVSHTQSSPPIASQPIEPGIIGVEFYVQAGTWPIMIQVFPGTPAQKAGLRPGDQLISVNQQGTQPMSAFDLDMAISDIPGTPINFRILRNGSPLQKTVVVAPASQAYQSTNFQPSVGLP